MCPSRGRRIHATPTSTTLLRATRLLLALLSQSTSTRAAVAASDLITYLGGTATGQTLTTVAYTLTMAANETAVLISCSYDGAMSDVGWIGFGVGNAMTDSDIVVLWPNSDSSWTLSHRIATSTTMPILVGDAVTPPSADSSGSLSIVSSLSSSSSSDSPTVVTFQRLLELNSSYTTAANYQLNKEINQGVIYAYGATNPGKDAQDADIEQHSLDMMGATYMDLSTPFTSDAAAIDAPLIPVKSSNSSSVSASSGGSSAVATASGTATAPAVTGGSSSSSSASLSTTASSSGGLSYSTVITIHGICAASAWLFFAPLAVLYARMGRGPPGTTLFRFPWHFMQQTWITTPLTIAAVGLAYYAATLEGDSSETYAHKTIGFCFFAALVVQDSLGWWAHCSSGPPRPGRPHARSLIGWLHIVLGVTLIGTGFVQCKLGMVRYGVSNELLLWGFWGCIVVFCGAYGLSLLFSLAKPAPPGRPPPMAYRRHYHRRRLPLRRRKKKKRRRRPRPRRRAAPSESSETTGSVSASGSETASDGSYDEEKGHSRSDSDSDGRSSGEELRSSDDEDDRRRRRRRTRY